MHGHPRPQTVTEATPGQCTNLLTQFNVQVLVTPIGSKSNPQYAVVGLKYAYTSGSFVYRCFPGTGCVDARRFNATLNAAVDALAAQAAWTGSASTSIKQAFRLSSTVTFQVVSEASVPYVPSAAQLGATLPSDMFYPFQLSAAPAARRPTLGASVVTLACAWAMWSGVWA
jgi:hypothetical protein